MSMPDFSDAPFHCPPDKRFGASHRVKWTEEHDASLKEFYDESYSFSQIAKSLNERFGTVYSRNACIGRASRIGIVERTKIKRIPKIRLPLSGGPKPWEGTGQSRSTYFRKVRAPQLTAEIIQFRCAEVVPLHLKLNDLEPHSCRYVYGEGPFTFCGLHQTADSSYCFDHYQLCRGDGTRSERLAAREAV